MRAWRGYSRFQKRSSLRTWLYRIATNVCLDLLRNDRRRARPMDLSDPVTRPSNLGDPLDDRSWIGPMPDARLGADPGEAAVSRESIRLAFVAVLQRLSPRQRAALLLREVVGLTAQEIADLIGWSVASVNSSLQRARATLAEHSAGSPAESPTDVQAVLADRFADAFERFDMEALPMLLHVDVTLSLPPYREWMRGPDEMRAWLLGPGVGCRGSRLLPTTANGSPAFAQYRPNPNSPGYYPWALQVLEVSGRRITGLTMFRDTDRLFPLFGLPDHLD